MKFLKTGLISLCIILLVSACTTTNKARKKKKIRFTKKEYLEAIKPELSKISPAQVIEAKKLAIYHVGNFYKGLKNKDYAIFSKSQKLGKKIFDNWCKALSSKYGKLESQKYLGVKAEPFAMLHVWKWVFKEKIMNEIIQRDVLFSVRIVKYKNKSKCSLLVIGFE